MLLHNKLKPIIHEEESSTYKLFSKYNFMIGHIWKEKQTLRWDASFSPPDCKPPSDGVFHVENAELPTWTKKL
ncbi:hypothetical protein, partial [Paramagnetospirillum caucaseum]|uniref:hypothetical protein n=1 Tax=Paramagnetospirillum caucaseum TaxID=1244869 RepID=UPI001F3F732D